MSRYILFFLLLKCTISFSQRKDTLPPLGSQIDIGGYKLHYYTKGEGKPTVVFIAGAKAFSFDWMFVQDKVATFAKTISYDRPGLAWSDPGPMPRTFNQDSYELHQLLRKLRLKPPFILVGHSYGAIIARQYTKNYPREVEGLVLVDPTSENTLLLMNNKVQRLRDWATGKPIPGIKTGVDTFTKVPTEKEWEDFLKMAGTPQIEPPFNQLPESIQKDRLWAMKQPKYMIADDGKYWADEFAQMYKDSMNYSLGARPLIVISSLQRIIPKNALDSARLQIAEDKVQNQRTMAKLSLNGKLLITEKSGHEIHLSEPDLVADAIKSVIAYGARAFHK